MAYEILLLYCQKKGGFIMEDREEKFKKYLQGLCVSELLSILAKLKENDFKEWAIDEILLHNPCGYNINGFL